ncbi:MAG: hypothetical protein GC154_16125 [bacterium]|nr:hypothetical protein [bacterium]
MKRIAADPPLTQRNGPWTPAGRFLHRFPALAAMGAFVLFWLYRSRVFSGDGDQLARLIDSGLWMVQTEILSHAAFQGTYQLLHPFGWDALSVINLVSCIAGAVCVWIVLRFNRDFTGCDPVWAMGLFFSSGLLILSCGHTEYYTMFLAGLLLYGYEGAAYLHGRGGALRAALAYSFAIWLHLGILFALPSLLILPWLKGEIKDYKGLAQGFIPTIAAFLFKEFHDALGIAIQGLSPSSNFIPLFSDPAGTRFYTMFEWGHLVDILYAWSMRSWIFWPLILICAAMYGWRAFLRSDRLFLLTYTLCFTFFCLVWHPNLGIEQDWDLFAIEAAPSLLLAMTFLPAFLASSFRRWALAIPLIASFLIVYHQIVEEAHFGRRGYGGVKIELSEDVDYSLTLNGAMKTLDSPTMTEGVYAVRLIDRTHRRTEERYAVVVPGMTTVVPIDVSASASAESVQ